MTTPPWQPVRERWYGPRAEHADVLLWVPHDGGVDGLTHTLPSLAAACCADTDLLTRYLTLERDDGSAALAHSLGQALAARALAVLVLEADLPRGLVDPARLPARAIRHVYRHDADPALFAALLELHGAAQSMFVRRVAQLDPQRGVFLDVHTMSAHDPLAASASSTEALVESPSTLADYVHAYRPRAGARLRPIDVITRAGEHRLADPWLAEELFAALREDGFDVARDTPYQSADHLVAYHAMRLRRGASIDVPKPFALSEEARARLVHACVRGVLAAVSSQPGVEARQGQQGVHRERAE